MEDMPVPAVDPITQLAAKMPGVRIAQSSGRPGSNPEIMIPYIQKKLHVSDTRLARKMYEEDAPSVSLTGVLNSDAAREILDTGREALRLKETIPLERVFDFSLASEALR